MAVDLEFEIGIFILFIHPTVTDAHFRFHRQHFRFLFGFVPFKNIYVTIDNNIIGEPGG